VVRCVDDRSSAGRLHQSRPAVSRLAARAVALAALVAGCSLIEQPLEPAPYQPPAPGTLYRYAGFSNRVVSSDGWRTTVADDSGRVGSRLALFITEDPGRPSQADTAQLAALWPLETGKRVDLAVRSGDQSWQWKFKVVGEQRIAVPAGTFRTFLVQGVQEPEHSANPRRATRVGYTWWYAPAVAAVVRFETTYLSGPAKGRVVKSELIGIDRPGSARN